MEPACLNAWNKLSIQHLKFAKEGLNTKFLSK